MRAGTPNIRTQSSTALSSSSGRYGSVGIKISPLQITKKRQSIAFIALCRGGVAIMLRLSRFTDKALKVPKTALVLLALCATLQSGCETVTEEQKTAHDASERALRDKDRAHNVRVAALDDIVRPRSTGQFDVVYPGEKPVRPIHEIAFLTFEGGAPDEAIALGAMIERARQLGSEGLLLRGTESPNSSLAIAHPLWQNPGERVFRASAFVYRDHNEK